MFRQEIQGLNDSLKIVWGQRIRASVQGLKNYE